MAVHFEIPTTRVEVGRGGYFTVRGMNSEELVFLSENYLDDIKTIVAKYAKTPMIAKSRVAELAMEVAKSFPMMTTEIISRCADSTDAEDIEKFRRLPFPVQLTALKEIAILTVIDGGVDLGNVSRVVAQILESNGIKPGPMMTLLQDTIAKYEKR